MYLRSQYARENLYQPLTHSRAIHDDLVQGMEIVSLTIHALALCPPGRDQPVKVFPSCCCKARTRYGTTAHVINITSLFSTVPIEKPIQYRQASPILGHFKKILVPSRLYIHSKSDAERRYSSRNVLAHALSHSSVRSMAVYSVAAQSYSMFSRFSASPTLGSPQTGPQTCASN